MKRSRLTPLVIATLATALPVAASRAQATTQPAQVQRQAQAISDSLAVEADSVPQHSWVVNVLRKVTFRGDDAAAADSAAAASAATSANAAAARRIPRTFDSKRDRAEYMSARAKADRATGYRIVVDIEDHRLYVIDGQDTLRSAPVATASNSTLRYGGKA